MYFNDQNETFMRHFEFKSSPNLGRFTNRTNPGLGRWICFCNPVFVFKAASKKQEEMRKCTLAKEKTENITSPQGKRCKTPLLQGAIAVWLNHC